MLDAGWTQALGTVLLGVVGLWFANSYRRKVKVQLAERQLDAYTRLWRITEAVTPDRQKPLSESDRKGLYEAMMKWYFADGDGVLLSARVRDLYVAVRTNLVAEPNRIRPTILAQQLASADESDAELRRGCIVIRQMSLLRTQLKADLSIHDGYRYYSALRREDRALLRECGIPLWRKPWRPRVQLFASTKRLNPCVCGSC